MSELTSKQEKFLELIFTSKYINDYEGAKVEAGYSANTTVHQIVLGLKEEILSRIESYLAINAPRAAKGIVDVLSNPEAKGNKSTLEAAAMLLDRVGIVKKERMEIEHKGATGVFLLPAKKIVD